MRLLGLALAGVLALTGPIAAHAGPLDGKRGAAPAGPKSAILQIGDGSGSGWRDHVASDHGGSWPFGPRVEAVNRGWYRQHWLPNGARVSTAPRPSPPTGSGFLEARSSIIPSLIGEAQQAGGVIRS
jgi:hypothetical protein